MLAAGDGGVHVTEADGANVSATATNSGAISIANLAGTLNVNGPIITDSGGISLGSADDLQVDAAIGADTFSGTISLVANTDGAGTQGFLQTLNGSLTTADTDLNAASITVGGSGDITLGVGSIGGASGGGLTVTANGGNILWNSGFTLGESAPDGGGNSNVLKAHDYTFPPAAAVPSARRRCPSKPTITPRVTTSPAATLCISPVAAAASTSGIGAAPTSRLPRRRPLVRATSRSSPPMPAATTSSSPATSAPRAATSNSGPTTTSLSAPASSSAGRPSAAP